MIKQPGDHRRAALFQPTKSNHQKVRKINAHVPWPVPETVQIGNPKNIEFDTYVDDDLELSIEVITPLLLIIDEITMNAVKHAFPDKTADNKITKSIKNLGNNTAELIIEDNGVGIKDSDKMIENLGCEIIKSLTKQLGGTIQLIKKEKGTAYKLTFPIQMEHTIE